MVTSKPDATQASQLFTQQAKVQSDTAQTVLSLMQASLTNPSLASIADNLAAQVYKAAETTLSQIQGVPLEPYAIQAGEKASQSIHEALQSMTQVRTAYWKSYKETEVPKNAEWLTDPSGNLEQIAKQLADMATTLPAAATVNSQQIMLAMPGDDFKAVLSRHKAAKQVPESGGYLGEMGSTLRSRVSDAKGLAAIADAQASNPTGRGITELLAELEVMVRDRHGSSAPRGAYFTMGVRSLVHPEEIKRLVAHAAKEFHENQDTSLLTFVGNVRYMLGYEMNVSGTESHWQAALEALK